MLSYFRCNSMYVCRAMSMFINFLFDVDGPYVVSEVHGLVLVTSVM